MPTPHTSLLACSLALATLSLSSPLPLRENWPTVRAPVPRRAGPGPVHYADIHRKYKVQVPREILAAAVNTDVLATPGAYDSGYLAPVNIGGQVLNLAFDTGSADLWVFSTELSSAQGAGHTLYNPNLSSSAQELPDSTWSATYVDGNSASGNVYTDTVTIDNITVTGQAVQLAESVSTSFQQNTNLSGLLGLGFGTINTVQPKREPTFFESAIREGIITDEVFTADLKAGEPGTYDFGVIDSSKYSGSIAYTPVDNSNGFWNITTTGLGIGSGSLSSISSAAIVDTGSSLIILDAAFVSAYWSGVSGATYDTIQGGYTFPCSTSLPDLQIAITGYVATVPGAYLNYAPISGNTCYGGLQSDAALSFSILGDTFIKSQFVVFDYGNLQVGLAQKASSTTTPASSTTSASTSSLTSITSQSTTTPTAESVTTTSENGFTVTETVTPTSTTYDDGMWHTTYWHQVTATPTTSCFSGYQNFTTYQNTTTFLAQTAAFTPSGTGSSSYSYAPSSTAYPAYPGYNNGTWSGTSNTTWYDWQLKRSRK